MNLYCRLICCYEASADYAVGSLANRLSGIVRFFSDGRMPEIIQAWEEEGHSMRRKVYSTYWKYEDVLRSGQFPEKMSREIG